MPFYKKIATYFFLFTLSISLLYFSLFVNRLRDASQKAMIKSGFLLTESLAHSSELSVYGQDPTFLVSTIQGIAKSENVLCLAVYTEDGGTIISEKKPEICNEAIPFSVLMEIKETKAGIRREGSTINGEKYYDFFVPIIPTGSLNYLNECRDQCAVIGVSRIMFSLEEIEKERNNLVLLGFGLSSIVIITGLFVSRILAKGIANPIALLSKGAKAVGAGDLGYRIKVTTGDELEDLGDAFNEMAKNLNQSRKGIEEAKSSLEQRVKTRTQELNNLTNSLENKVKERTDELQQRVDELEKFHRLTVGRELRMMELKKEIRQLEKKIAGDSKKAGQDLKKS